MHLLLHAGLQLRAGFRKKRALLSSHLQGPALILACGTIEGNDCCTPLAQVSLHSTLADEQGPSDPPKQHWGATPVYCEHHKVCQEKQPKPAPVGPAGGPTCFCACCCAH